MEQTEQTGLEDSGIESRLPPISIKAEPLFDIPTPLGNLTFTNSMLYTLIVIAALVIFFALVTRRMTLVPRGAQNFAEAVIEFLLGTTESTAGKRVGRRIFPLIATLFLFIIVSNWSGLLPGVGTIGFCAEHQVAEATPAAIVAKVAAPAFEEDAPAREGGLPGVKCKDPNKVFVPFLRAPNADLSTTLAMALLAVGVVQVAGIASHGVKSYLKELVTPIFLAPIHIMGEFSRIISLSFRLFGNIFGGEVLMTVMYALLGSIFVGFGAVIFVGLEVLFGFIQAFLFSVLTLVYIAVAVAGHGGGGSHSGDRGDEHAGVQDHAPDAHDVEARDETHGTAMHAG